MNSILDKLNLRCQLDFGNRLTAQYKSYTSDVKMGKTEEQTLKEEKERAEDKSSRKAFGSREKRNCQKRRKSKSQDECLNFKKMVVFKLYRRQGE